LYKDNIPAIQYDVPVSYNFFFFKLGCR